MVIVVSADGTVELRDPDEFTQLQVEPAEVADAEADRDRWAVAEPAIGRLERPDHVWIDPIALSELAGTRATDPAWTAGLEKMLTYAQSKGWVDDAGRVRAHVARPAG